MLINRANLNELYQSYQTAFNDAFTKPGEAEKKRNALVLTMVAMMATVGGAAVVHAWLETLPALKKWVGTRQIKNISGQKLTIANEDFANAVAVKKNDIKDDTYGVYTPLIGALGAQARSLWTRLAVTALLANGNWADGAPFFGTTRKYGKNALVNKTTNALDETSFGVAVKTMRSYLDSEDEPLEVEPLVLLVGPKLEQVAIELVQNSLKSAGTGKGGAIENWAKGIAQVMVSPRLVGDYDDHWYLLGEQHGLKPIYVQKREEPALVSQDDDGTDAAFLNNEYRYGVEARGAAFLTLPHLAYAGIL